MQTRHFREQIRVLSLNQLTRNYIGLLEQRNLAVSISSPSEQRAIIEKYLLKSAPLLAQMQQARHEISSLAEFRTRLIADVVIGKLVVREFARTLPADIAEETAELAISELGDDEFSEADDELAGQLTGEPA